MSFSQDINSEICLKTKEKAVYISYDPSSIQPDNNMKLCMQKCMKGIATNEEQKTFQYLWQQRVENILINYKQVISIV